MKQIKLHISFLVLVSGLISCNNSGANDAAFNAAAQAALETVDLNQVQTKLEDFLTKLSDPNLLQASLNIQYSEAEIKAINPAINSLTKDLNELSKAQLSAYLLSPPGLNSKVDQHLSNAIAAIFPARAPVTSVAGGQGRPSVYIALSLSGLSALNAFHPSAHSIGANLVNLQGKIIYANGAAQTLITALGLPAATNAAPVAQMKQVASATASTYNWGAAYCLYDYISGEKKCVNPKASQTCSISLNDYSAPGPVVGSRVVTVKPDAGNDVSVTPPAIPLGYLVGSATTIHNFGSVSFKFSPDSSEDRCETPTTGNGFCGLQAAAGGVSSMEDCDSGNPAGSLYCDCHGLIRNRAVCVNTGTCDTTDTKENGAASKCQFLDPARKGSDTTGAPGLQSVPSSGGTCTGANQYLDQGVCVTAGESGYACKFDGTTCTSGSCKPGITCNPNGVCGGCTKPSDCNSGVCLTTGQCKPAAATHHNSNACSPTCGTGESCCSKACVDLLTDSHDCGTCGTVCDAACVGGVCVF